MYYNPLSSDLMPTFLSNSNINKRLGCWSFLFLLIIHTTCNSLFFVEGFTTITTTPSTAIKSNNEAIMSLQVRQRLIRGRFDKKPLVSLFLSSQSHFDDSLLSSIKERRRNTSQMTMFNRQSSSFASSSLMLTDRTFQSQYFARTKYSILKAESSSESSPPKEKNNNNKNNQQNKKKKIKLVDPSKVNVNALTAAFDEMAKKEGFDESTAYYADDATFEDDFNHDEMDGDLDFDDLDDDDDVIDFGDDSGGVAMSMEERINEARRDSAMGKFSVPDQLDDFSNKATKEELKKLGFKQELNPFGNDETPRKSSFKLITDAMKCSACGSRFQGANELKPGYLPPQKFEIQRKLSKIEEAQRIQEKAESDEGDWSPEDEIEWLIQSEGTANPNDDTAGVDIDAMAEDLGIDLLDLTEEKKVICKRCHGLQNFGEAPEMLRPGWTDEPMLSQEKFRHLLLPLKEKPAVIVALVDLFDFSGSILPELDSIAGENPVIIAANKADLLPSKMGQTRAENWVRRELEYLGVECIANIGGAVRLVSCKTGFGIAQMLAKAKGLADEYDCDIYVVGAANAGKSTLINHIIEKNNFDKDKPRAKKRAGNSNARKGAVTTSPLPGTTLEFIKIEMGDGLTLYDTPGLLVPKTLTQRLTPAELKMVVPKR